MFIQPPSHLNIYYAGWTRVVIGCALAEVQRLYKDTGEPLQRRACFLLDEAWALGQSARIENMVRTLRGANAQIVMAFQSPAQLREIYRNAQSVQDSCDVWQISGGEKNLELTRLASELAGDMTVASSGETKSNSGNSESKSETVRRLIKPDEIRNMDKYEQLLFVGNLAFKGKKPFWEKIGRLKQDVHDAEIAALLALDEPSDPDPDPCVFECD